MARGALPGERRGGRAKGTPNRRTQEQIASIAETGATPLDYLIGVMRDESAEKSVRLDAAGKAAPYVHPRLSSSDLRLEVENDPFRRPHEMTDMELILSILEGGGDHAKEVRAFIDSRIDSWLDEELKHNDGSPDAQG